MCWFKSSWRQQTEPDPCGRVFRLMGCSGLETERQAKPPAEGLQRRRPEPDYRKAKARSSWPQGQPSRAQGFPHFLGLFDKMVGFLHINVDIRQNWCKASAELGSVLLKIGYKKPVGATFLMSAEGQGPVGRTANTASTSSTPSTTSTAGTANNSEIKISC